VVNIGKKITISVIELNKPKEENLKTLYKNIVNVIGGY